MLPGSVLGSVLVSARLRRAPLLHACECVRLRVATAAHPTDYDFRRHNIARVSWILPVLLIIGGLAIWLDAGWTASTAHDRFRKIRPDWREASSDELRKAEPDSFAYLAWASVVIMPILVLGGVGWLIWILT